MFQCFHCWNDEFHWKINSNSHNIKTHYRYRVNYNNLMTKITVEIHLPKKIKSVIRFSLFDVSHVMTRNTKNQNHSHQNPLTRTKKIMNLTTQNRHVESMNFWTLFCFPFREIFFEFIGEFIYVIRLDSLDPFAIKFYS